MIIKKHFIRAIGFLVGLLIFFYTIHTFGGFKAIFNNLIELKYFYVFVILNSFIWMLLYTEAWHHLFHGLKHQIRYLSLLKIKLSGEGVNFMTPLGFIVGDPIRVLMLKKHLGMEARLREVAIDRLMHSLSAQFFCLIGIILIFTQSIHFPLWLHLFLIFIYLVLCIFFVILIVSMITGKGFSFFEHIFRFLKIETRFPRLDKMIDNLHESLEYYKDRSKGPFLICFLYHFIGRVLGAVEILIVFYCYQGHGDFVFAWILASLTSFFSIVFGFIPGALGVLESMYANFFMLYGLDPEVGVSIQIVRRLRVIFWMAIGVFVLDYAEIAEFIKNFKQKKVGEHHE